MQGTEPIERRYLSFSRCFVAALVLSSLAAGSARADFNTETTSNFNSTAIPGGDTIWFNSDFHVGGATMPTQTFNVYFNNVSIDFTANGKDYVVAVPNSEITFSKTATAATTTFNAATNTWVTVAPMGLTGNTFLDGVAFHVPTAGLPGGITSVTWEGTMTSDHAIAVGWQTGASVYKSFAGNSAIGVKPVDDSSASIYHNSDLAGTPENEKSFLTLGGTGNGGTNYTGSLSDVTCFCHVPVVPEPSSLVLALVAGTLGLGKVGLRGLGRAARS
jgi:hypothetical protein